VSKERARRRAAREAELARAAAVRADREARIARRRARLARAAALVPRPIRIARQGGVRARRRRVQNGGVLVLFLIVQAIAWLTLSGWAVLGVLVLSLLLIPVLVTVVFDRRS
jgi:hypothetical protein